MDGKNESEEYIEGAKEKLFYNPRIYFILTIIGVVL